MSTSVQDHHEEAIDTADASLLRLARAVWHLRFWIFLTVIAGGVVGGAAYWKRPRLQTTATLRWISPHVSYLSTFYWDVTGKIRQSQLQGLAANMPHRDLMNVRPQKEAWLLLLEVQHELPNEGQRTIEQWLSALRETEDKSSQMQKSVSVDAVSEQLIATLTQLDVLLDTLSAPEPAESSRSFGERLPSPLSLDGSARLPLANTPWFPWYSHLKQRANACLASNLTPVHSPDRKRLIQLTDNAAGMLLRHWSTMDVLSSSAELPAWRVESITTIEIRTLERLLRDVAAGVWVSLTLCLLLVVPIRWLAENWKQVTATSQPNN